MKARASQIEISKITNEKMYVSSKICILTAGRTTSTSKENDKVQLALVMRP